jgi:opacity protein-like surface antigen
MRAIIYCVLFISSSAIQIFAQSEKGNDSSSFEGKKALVLSVSGAISYTQFSGGIGGKYWISDNYFVKAVVSGSVQQSTSDTSSMDAQGIIAGNIYLARTLYSMKHLCPYAGIGVGIGRTKNIFAEDGLVWPHDFGSNLFVSGTIFFGVEYLLWDNFSFSAEESIIAEYVHSYTFNTTSWSIGSTASTLTMSIYF